METASFFNTETIYLQQGRVKSSVQVDLPPYRVLADPPTDELPVLLSKTSQESPICAQTGARSSRAIEKGADQGYNLSMETIRKFQANNGAEVTIRPALPDDSCAILSTVRSNAMERSYVLMEQYGKDDEAEREYISGLNEADNLLIVSVIDNNAVGCLAALQADAGLRPETRHILHVGLHIREAFRGLGIGPQLLGYSIEWAREKGFKKLEANIFTTNKRSLSMFKKAGFAEEGVRKNRIQMGADFINEVLMGKML